MYVFYSNNYKFKYNMRKKIMTYKLFILLLFLINNFEIFSQKFSNKKISRIISKEQSLNGSSVAFSLSRMNNGRRIVNYNSDKLMTPGSNIKLLTLYMALKNFDSFPILNYNKKNNKFYFWSTGYPLLKHSKENDSTILEFLKSQKDSLIYIPKKNQSNLLGPGWAWDDVNYYFSPERSIFPIFGNLIKIKKTENDKNKLDFVPKYFEDKLSNNHLNLVNDFKADNGRDSILIPFKTSDSLFVKLLNTELGKEIGIEFNKFELPKNFKTLYSKNSSLYKLLIQDSDNLVAESIIMMVSGLESVDFNIEKQIKTFLKEEFRKWYDTIIWVDGSGLSRYNLLNTEFILSVLNKIHEILGRQGIADLFPNYLSNYDKIGSVFAKTGTLRNNRCLSGYIYKGQERYIFSLMVSNHNSSVTELNASFRNILEKISKKL